MLTRRGWGTVLAGVVFLITGRVLGAIEFYVIGATLFALLGGTILWLQLTRLDLDVARELHPPRVHAGSPSRVDLKVHNRGRRRTPVLNLRDAVEGTRGANLLVAPLAPDGVDRAAYRLPTERRGILGIGPLEVVLSDPFLLTRVTMQATGVSELTVYPHVDDIPPVPQTSGNDPMAGAEHPNALGRGGEDFYALRQYVVGDDLRRVHWASTARHDDLMVRQDEVPWQGRATVLADVRASANTDASLELVISAAASIVTAGGRRQDLVRLVATDGTDSGFAAGHAHIETILERLASLEATNDAALRRVVDRLARSTSGGALVVVVASIAPDDLDRLLRLRHRFGAVTVVAFEPSSWGGRDTAPDVAVPADRRAAAPRAVVRVTADTPFPTAWRRATTRRSRRVAALTGPRR